MKWIHSYEYTRGTVAGLPRLKKPGGNRGTTKKVPTYRDAICAFDIETTRLADIEQSIMYIWQFRIHGVVTVIGRTWEELREFLQTVVDELDGGTLIIYVHNLSYEFQFLRAIIDWKIDDVFAVDSRKVLKATAYDGALEFRCSYLHSNMSLGEFTNKFHVEHQKLSGDDFDYTKLRYPWTPISERELQYCINDVVGLCEALAVEMSIDGDTLYTIPLTSTGYVRRDAKKAMRRIDHRYAKDQAPDLHVYHMLREAFRGGNTHANRYFSERILENVTSYDRSSSYPEVLCNHRYPCTAFRPVENPSEKEYRYRKNKLKQAILMRVSFHHLRLRNKYWGAPYLSRDKCRNIMTGVFDNGRILECEYLETTITDVDMDIVESEYTWDDFSIRELCYAHYGKLPKPFTDTIIEYYRRKTKLKNIPDQVICYVKAKNMLNALYGMCAQDPVKPSTIFDSENPQHPVDPLKPYAVWYQDESKTEEELLEKSNSKAFLPYHVGVWVTAWARYELERGIQIAGENFVYCDTDSVKFIGDADFTEYNCEKIKISGETGAHATDKHGEEHFMGVYELDEEYSTFATLGAKKYAYTYEDGKTHVTIAGVTKRTGGEELDEHGGLQAFIDQHPVYNKRGEMTGTEGFTFVKSGGTESVWNDDPPIKTTIREGREIAITPNVVIRDSTYTLGLTAEYKSILENSCLPIDFWCNL